MTCSELITADSAQLRQYSKSSNTFPYERLDIILKASDSHTNTCSHVIFALVGVKCCDAFLLSYLTFCCPPLPSVCCTKPLAAMAGHHLAIGCNTMVDGHMPSHMGYAPFSCRSPSEAPLRKLTVDLIKTYRKINEVQTVVCLFVCLFGCWVV